MRNSDRTLPPSGLASTHSHTGFCEELIKKILDRAAKTAEKCNPGDSFTVEWDTRNVPKGIHFQQICDPIIDQSLEYGLLAGTCFNWKFEFMKL